MRTPLPVNWTDGTQEPTDDGPLAMSIDLPAYFARVGYDGPSEPTLPVLRDLHARHLTQIAFEGLDPFLGRSVSIDSDAIQAKLVKGRRGGYCHEQNSLFHDVLAGLGFAVTALGGRVVWMRPGLDAPTTHRLTLVAVEGERYVVDVGFGPQGPPTPLLLAHGLEQATSHGAFRVMREGGRYEVQDRAPGGWTPLYHFTLDAPARADFEVANWFMSTHPRTLFVRNLIAARLVGGTRVTLLNASLSVRLPDGDISERKLPDAEALGAALENTMGLALPVPADTIWARLPEEFMPAWP